MQERLNPKMTQAVSRPMYRQEKQYPTAPEGQISPFERNIRHDIRKIITGRQESVIAARHQSAAERAEARFRERYM